MGNAFGKSSDKPTWDGRLRVLCYGDSLTAGFVIGSPYTGDYFPWAPVLAAALRASPGTAHAPEVVHAGLSGWTTQQMVDSLDAPACEDVCLVASPGLRDMLRVAAAKGQACV